MATTTPATRIVLLLDLYTGASTDTWLSKVGPLPIAPDHVLTLTGVGVEQRPRPADVFGAKLWRDLGKAVEMLAVRALEFASRAEGEPELLIGGKAPLCLFTHLGYRLSRFKNPPVFLGFDKTGATLESFDLTRPSAGAAVLKQRTRLPREVSPSGGVVPVYVDMGGRAVDKDMIFGALRSHGLQPTELVEARTPTPATLTPQNASRAAEELVDLFSQLPSVYRRAEAFALFLAGPTLLAFLAGRAVNPNVCQQPILLTEHRPDKYTLTYRLPFAPRGPDAALTSGASSVRVLILTANPGLGSTRRDLEPAAGAAPRPSVGVAPGVLNLEQELYVIRKALHEKPPFEHKIVAAARRSELHSYLKSYRPHVVHFCGHADHDGVVLLDEAGLPAPVPPAVLRTLFELWCDDPGNDMRLVVLNACRTSEQAEVLAGVVDCAIGTPHAIEDAAAIDLAASLYENLAEGETIRRAVEFSNNDLARKGRPPSAGLRLFTSGVAAG